MIRGRAARLPKPRPATPAVCTHKAALEADTYCRTCGALLRPTCGHCGAVEAPHATFCAKCGTRLERSDAAMDDAGERPV